MAQETGSPGGPARRRAPAWPPPGLESIEGRLWTAIMLLAVGGLAIAVPVLVTAALPRPFWSLGPFGTAWWAPAMAAVLGMVAALAGFDRLFRLLWLGANAARDGHDWRTVFAVAADAGDTGHLLAGTAQFSWTAPRERRWTLIARLTGATLGLAAALWLPLGLILSTLLAANAGLSTTAVWALTLAPTGVLALTALLSRALERSVVGGAERSWRAHQPAELALRSEIARWNREAMAALERAGDPEERLPIAATSGATEPGAGSASRLFRAAALATLVMGPLVVLLVGTFTIASAIGPVLGTLGNASGFELPRRALQVEPLRALRVTPDSGITPQEAAGELTTVLAVGRRARLRPFTPAPDTTYANHWFGDEDAFGMGPGRYPANLFQRVAEGLTDEQRSFLARVADHPAQARFSRLARAPVADVAAARWAMPLPDTVPWAELDRPGGDIRSAARAHIVRAAYLVDRGRDAEADTVLREVVSVGFLLLDDGPTLSDAVQGITLIRDGARGLENLYRVTGQAERARRIADDIALGTRMSRLAAAVAPGSSSLQGVPDLVLDPEAVRGLRWNRFATLATVGPCLNPHSAIFGPGRDYRAWLAQADSALVRWPSEEQIFQHRRYGDLVPPARAANTVAHILGITFGGPGPGSCAALLGTARRR